MLMAEVGPERVAENVPGLAAVLTWVVRNTLMANVLLELR